MSSLLALDPGYAEGCGVAFFTGGRLRTTDFIKVPSDSPSDLVARCAAAARAVLLRVAELERLGLKVSELVVEWPQIYPASRSKGDPNDLLGLAAVCAAVAIGQAWRITSVKPRDWKGMTPKPKPGRPYVMERRVRSRLAASEAPHMPAGVRHDVIDAVGIGLHHLGRLERVRVIPR